MRDNGKCIICGNNATNSHFCEKHAHKANEMSKSLYHRNKEEKAVSH
jgi:hypothetical protein